jgi:hypothetical protein
VTSRNFMNYRIVSLLSDQHCLVAPYACPCPYTIRARWQFAKKFPGRRECDLSRRRWSAFNFRRGSGRRSTRSCVRNAEQGAQPTTTASSSKPCCGGAAQVCHGGTCHRTSALGRACSTASIVGPRRANGSGCSWHCRQTGTTSGTAWTARSTGPTSMHLVEKGGCGTGHRSVARRAVDQGAFGGRCAWFAAHL